MEKYIKDLLFEHDCVVVPGFGGFITQYVSADIHPITHKFTPPSKRIAFNEQLKANDGLLVNAIIAAENISREEAAGKINEFVEKIRAHIQKSIFEIKDIGRLFYNTDNCLEFEPDTTLNYFEESYGLSELFFKPIERNFTTMNKPNVEKPQRQRPVADADYTKHPEGGSNSGLIVFAVIFLILAGATTFLYFNQDSKDLASINPFVIFKGEEKVVEVPKTPTPVVQEETVTETEAPAHEEVITSKTGRYFIVVGSFKSKDNAFKMKEQYENQNQMVSIIEPYDKKKYYRISIADFDTKENAINKLAELKETYGNSIWVLSY